MIRKLVTAVLLAGLAGGGLFFVLTMPDPLPDSAIPDHQPDLANGALLFDAGGCAGCHAAKGAEGEARLALGGGLEMHTPFGLFRVPNISPDPEAGIGGWSQRDFANAMLRGLSPDGAHYYPAFPYTSYARMTVTDVLDLKAFLDTLPPVRTTVAGHEIGFPFNIRRGLGLWKHLNLSDAPVVTLAADASQAVKRGRYLVEGPGHCGECHTRRDPMGGPVLADWLAGAPNPDGEGVIPNITPGEGGIGGWSEAEIAYSLETGFDPAFDSFGGSMVEVQENMARLPAADRAAIAAYLKAVPALADAVPAAP